MIVRRALPSFAAPLLAVALSLGSLSALGGNTITGLNAAVAGGDQNTASGGYAVVAGGQQNSASGPIGPPFYYGPNSYAAVGGGSNNAANDYWATVGGGEDNVAGYGSTVAGGSNNHANNASVIGGGAFNSANGYGSAIGGGIYNATSGEGSVVPGGGYNQAGAPYSFAAGWGAHVRGSSEAANDAGTFVWSDYTADPTASPPSVYASSGPNQFLVRANGGFALNTTPVNANVAMTIAGTASNPGYASLFLRQSNSNSGVLVSSGDATTGLSSPANNAAFYVDQYNGSGHTRRLSLDGSGNLLITAQAYKPGGGAWAASSDARLKTNVQPLDHALDRLLALRGVTFEYAHPDTRMHPGGIFTGFIAQEVEPTFPNWIGRDEDGYLTVGPQGFEALTVEALRTLATQNAALTQENEVLQERLSQQEQLATDVIELRAQVLALSARVAL